MKRRYPRRNQAVAMAEADVLLTVTGVLLLGGLLYVVVAAIVNGTAQGIKAAQNSVQPTSFEQSTVIGQGGSTETLPS